MDQAGYCTEFSCQVDKHKAILKKYGAISTVVTYARALLFLLTAASVYFVIVIDFKTELVVTGLIGILAFISLWLYHDKVREKLSHAAEIIAINKEHIKNVSAMLTDFPGVEMDFLYPEDLPSEDFDITELCKDMDFIDQTVNSYTEYFTVYSIKPPENEEAGRLIPAKSSASRFLLM